MWTRYLMPAPDDTLGRDHWFTMRSEDATDGRVTLVLIDWPAGQPRPTVERSEMPREDAVTLAKETGEALTDEGWSLDTSRLIPW